MNGTIVSPSSNSSSSSANGGALTPHVSHAKVKRSIQVVAPEKEDGNIEYKRQLHKPSPSRLRSLATQMSYRLDEGMGYCIYYIGVEDDGCHSLLDYNTIDESSVVLEYIARSLNCIVLKKVMVQNEVMLNGNGAGNGNGNGAGNRKNGNKSESECESSSGSSTCTNSTGTRRSDKDHVDVVSVIDNKNTCNKNVVKIDIEPLFKDGNYKNDEEDEDEQQQEKEEKTSENYTNGNDNKNQLVSLVQDSNVFTRCEIYIRRIETHLLDAKPMSLMEVAKGNKNGKIKYVHADEEEKTNKANTDGDAKIDVAKITSGINQMGVNSKTVSESKEEPSTTTTSSSLKNVKNDDKTTISETLSARNIRVAVVGNVDAGKSTLIGTLTTSCLDDGRGRSRTSIMKHRHEIESGRTSTATTHLMGFRHTGEPIAGRDSIRANKRKSEDEIARESYRVVTLMDLAGHEKYLKTTIHGVSSGMADYSMILVNSRHPPTHMTQHHLNLCCSFGIPTIVVFTKTDGCPDHALKNSKEELFKLLRAPDVGRRPFAIRKEQDIVTCIGKLNSLAPVIETSCVSGEGLNLLRKLLFSLPKRRRHEKKANRAFEFLVEDIFNVPGVGSVASGFVNAGELTVGSNCNVYVGPTNDGTFMKTVAKSAHIARINTAQVTSGQSACLAFALKKEDRLKLRRGMVVLRESPSSTREFDAEICVLKGEGTTIRRSYQAYVHILNVRQSAFAKNIEIVNTNALGLPPSHAAHNDDDDGIVLRPGSRAKVRFEFAQRPEYIRPGMRMLFRDGRVRGVGIITGIPQIQPVK